MRELGRDGIRRRLTDVVSEIRQWPETIAYRRWLWRYYRTLAGRDPVRGQKLLDDLGKHLQAMRRLGDPLTSRTKTLKFEISAFFFGLPAEPQIWRDLKDSYVGFIGEWFEPTARASRSN